MTIRAWLSSDTWSTVVRLSGCMLAAFTLANCAAQPPVVGDVAREEAIVPVEHAGSSAEPGERAIDGVGASGAVSAPVSEESVQVLFGRLTELYEPEAVANGQNLAFEVVSGAERTAHGYSRDEWGVTVTRGLIEDLFSRE